jgi:hypothetical protein
VGRTHRPNSGDTHTIIIMESTKSITYLVAEDDHLTPSCNQDRRCLQLQDHGIGSHTRNRHKPRWGCYNTILNHHQNQTKSQSSFNCPKIQQKFAKTRKHHQPPNRSQPAKESRCNEDRQKKLLSTVAQIGIVFLRRQEDTMMSGHVAMATTTSYEDC